MPKNRFPQNDINDIQAESLSDSELFHLLSDSSYELTHNIEKATWCKLYLIAPASTTIIRFINQQLGRREYLKHTDYSAVKAEYLRLRKTIKAFLNSISSEGILSCSVLLNWNYVVILYADPNEMPYELFQQKLSTIEDVFQRQITKGTPENWFVKSPVGEAVHDLGRMYLETQISLNVLQFTGHCMERKERISDHSQDGRFLAEQKRVERDYYLRLCACDVDGAIEQLDQLLDMAGHGIYKDISVFKQQMCACMEMASVMLGFRSGKEQLLSDLIPAYALDIGKTGAIRSRREFREATVQMIRTLKEKVNFADSIKTTTVQDAVLIIQKKFSDPTFSAKDLSSKMNYHMSHISKAFRSETNYTVSGYIRHLRIELAKELLRHTDYTISKVAAGAGFNSEKTFYRVFMAEEGITPNIYRKQVHGERNETK